MVLLHQSLNSKIFVWFFIYKKVETFDFASHFEKKTVTWIKLPNMVTASPLSQNHKIIYLLPSQKYLNNTKDNIFP